MASDDILDCMFIVTVTKPSNDALVCKACGFLWTANRKIRGVPRGTVDRCPNCGSQRVEQCQPGRLYIG
jgi:predicted Zn-ribbon and HTH transcriptional regulator